VHEVCDRVLGRRDGVFARTGVGDDDLEILVAQH